MKIRKDMVGTIKRKEEFYIETITDRQYDLCVKAFKDAGFGFTTGSYGKCMLFKYSSILQYCWTSNFFPPEAKSISFDDFKDQYCEGYEEEPVVNKPKLHDKQVLELAELIKVQDNLVQCLKDNGALIKDLKARMGVE